MDHFSGSGYLLLKTKFLKFMRKIACKHVSTCNGARGRYAVVSDPQFAKGTRASALPEQYVMYNTGTTVVFY